MKDLSKVTLVAIDCYNYGGAVASLKKSMEQCKFGSVKFLTDIEIEIDDVEVIQIPTITSKEEYSNFCIKELDKYFDTEFVLITQHDAWVLDGDSWDDDFYNYDYIGSPWLYSDGRNVGNGGFSLRSKKLHNILAKDWEIKITSPEDEIIARLYRNYLEYTYQVKFAPEELAHKFSFELNQPKQKTFGFHGNFHAPYKPYVVIKRTGAIGDVLLTEPIMKEFISNGYNVVLDTLPEIYELFSNHSYYIEHKSIFDRRKIVPEKVINLDMSYESKPKQNRLKTYFEFAGIKDYKLSRPTLFPLVDNKTKLFKKYVILHIDKKPMPYRNVFGVNWEGVRDYLESLGYSVIQIGKEEHDSVGLEMNTPSIAFLKFLIAGCDMFIGIDSGPLNIAMAYNKPCIGFFGSVNPEYVFPDLNNLEIIQQFCIKQHCYHNTATTVGTECEFNKELPPCCISDTKQVIDKIKNLTNKNVMAVESHKIKNKIENYLNGNVIEIGCGDATVVDGAFGIDGRVFPCVNHVTNNLYNLPKQLPNKLNSFDCCFSSHTLEHLPDSYRCVIEWSEFIKIGGYFILYLPDGEYYDNYENREHFHDTTYKQFLFWFKRAFCGEALNFKGEPYQKSLFELVEHGQDVGSDRYSFYLVAKKIN